MSGTVSPSWLCTIRVGPGLESEIMATVKDELIELVRDLDNEGAADVLDYVRWLLSEEDDPLTEEERSEVKEAEAEVARGNYVTLDELERKLGL